MAYSGREIQGGSKERVRGKGKSVFGKIRGKLMAVRCGQPLTYKQNVICCHSLYICLHYSCGIRRD